MTWPPACAALTRHPPKLERRLSAMGLVDQTLPSVMLYELSPAIAASGQSGHDSLSFNC